MAGLDASKQVTANINNSNAQGKGNITTNLLTTNGMVIDNTITGLAKAQHRLRFITYGSGNDNHWIDMFYNKNETGMTDEGLVANLKYKD